jgi:carboxylesterase
MSDVVEAQPESAARTSPAVPPAATADAVFLLHGLGGTQYDLGSMHKRLKNAGFVTHALTLPGHGTTPEDLVGITAEDWIDAVASKYREIRDAHPTLHLMGMCMGSLLAAVLAQREAHSKGRLIMLAPPVFIDGWATPWYRSLRPLLYAVPAIRNRMKIEEEDPFGIKNEQLRAIVKSKFERGENFHYRWVPLECIRQVDRLRAIVMAGAPKIRCQTLVVHAREDELTSLRSANFLVERIGGGRARMVVLEDSYHMVCVDNDREIVAKNVLEFLGAALPGATSALANDPKMSEADLQAAIASLTSCLSNGDFAGVRALGIPDLAWVQPGISRVAGAHVGKALGAFSGLMADDRSGKPRFAAFGTPAFNRGIALVPATLVARRADAMLESQGALLSAWHAGRLLEVRWFADDLEREDAFFGPPDATTDAVGALEQQFEAATAMSRTLKRAPDNDTLLTLYALYKQASAGDVTGDRPGALDMVGRAKYDAWAKKQGVKRDEAIKAYVALVDELRKREGG